MVALVLLPKDVGKLAFGVLHLMPLIDHDILPVILIQLQPILQDEVIGGDADVPFCCPHDTLGLGTSVGVALVDYLADGRRPLLEFSHPVRNSGERSNDEEGAEVFLVLDEVA